MDSIEKVIYINLEHRVDRKEHIEQELIKVFPLDKIIRFNAIKHEKGGIGCSMSHIGALEMAIQNKWKNVLIVEDDMQWNELEKGTRILNDIIKKEYNVIIFGGTFPIYDRKTYRLKRCQSRTAYLIRDTYYETLLNNYKTGLSFLLKSYESRYRGDVFWRQLHSDKWYIIVPPLCIQKPDYSDIVKTNVNYTSYFKPVKDSILSKILNIKA